MSSCMSNASSRNSYNLFGGKNPDDDDKCINALGQASRNHGQEPSAPGRISFPGTLYHKVLDKTFDLWYTHAHAMCRIGSLTPRSTCPAACARHRGPALHPRDHGERRLLYGRSRMGGSGDGRDGARHRVPGSSPLARQGLADYLARRGAVRFCPRRPGHLLESAAGGYACPHAAQPQISAQPVSTPVGGGGDLPGDLRHGTAPPAALCLAASLWRGGDLRGNFLRARGSRDGAVLHARGSCGAVLPGGLGQRGDGRGFWRTPRSIRNHHCKEVRWLDSIPSAGVTRWKLEEPTALPSGSAGRRRHPPRRNSTV